MKTNERDKDEETNRIADHCLLVHVECPSSVRRKREREREGRERVPLGRDYAEKMIYIVDGAKRV